jgi:hypothetical protein
MYDTALDDGPCDGLSDRSGDTRRPIDARDEDVAHAAVLELGWSTISQNVAPSVSDIQMPSTSLQPSMHTATTMLTASRRARPPSYDAVNWASR